MQVRKAWLTALILFGMLVNIGCISHNHNSSSECVIESYKDIEFGHNLLSHFTLDTNLVNINFGSFGAVPKIVQQNQSNYRQILQNSPDAWFRFIQLPHLINTQKSIAAYIGIKDWTDLVFIPNASNGCNTILKSIALHLQKQAILARSTNSNNEYPQFRILCFNTAYPMIKNTLNLITQFFGYSIEIFEFEVSTAMMNDQSLLLRALEQLLTDFEDIYAAVFSHISSVPSFIFDVKSITELLHTYNVLSIIDGAHAIGHIKLDLSDINCDFYVSNAHKWLMAPQGSAVMFVKREYQSMIYPLVMSSGAPSFGNKYMDSMDTSAYSQFQKGFVYQGTNDLSAWLAMSAALEFRDVITRNNEQFINEYCHDLAVRAGNLMAEMWDTARLVTNDENVGNMVNVKMPTQEEEEVYRVRNLLFHQSSAEEKYAFLVIGEWEGWFYVRICAQIFNELSDFRWLATQVLEILTQVRYIK